MVFGPIYVPAAGLCPQTPKSLHYGTWGGFNYLKKQALAGHRAQIDNTSVAAWPLAILKDIQRACGHRCAPRVMGTGPVQFGTVFGSFFGVQKGWFLGPFTCRRLGFAPKPQSHCTMAPGGASISSKNKPGQGTGHK